VLTRKGKAEVITLFNGWLEERVKMQHTVTAMKNHILQQAYGLRAEVEKINLDDE
jgi:hypothetical protein